MLVVNLNALPAKTRRAFVELEKTLPFCVGADGLILEAVQSKRNGCSVDGNRCRIEYVRPNYIFRAFRHVVEREGAPFQLCEQCAFERLGLMKDESRNAVLNTNGAKMLIRLLAVMGYDYLELYTEDTYEIGNEPYFGYLRGRYTKSELKEIVRYADDFGIEIVPCIQTLAHLNCLTRWPRYAPLIDIDDILLADDEGTYDLIDRMFATLAECFTSRRVNIGMDEAIRVGLGTYLAQHGFHSRVEIMVRHLKRVTGIAAGYGFHCAMWSDMFFRLAHEGNYYSEDETPLGEDVVALIPDDIDLIYWDYYSVDQKHYQTMLKKHGVLRNNLIFAAGAWTWVGFLPHNRYAMEACAASVAACKEYGVKDYFITTWGDDGSECSVFAALPALHFAAETAYGVGGADAIRLSFQTLTGVPLHDFMLLDAVNRVIPAQPDTKEPFTAPCKYGLYNDCLSGIFDPLIESGDGQKFIPVAKELKKASKYRDWKFLFEKARYLSETLSYKYDLGVRTTEFYRAGDKKGLRALIRTRYRPAIKSLKKFYRAFAAEWHKFNRPQGFEVQDARIGGLLLRLEHCEKRLRDYVCGKVKSLPELEEERLDPTGEETQGQKRSIVSPGYGHCISTGVL